MPEVDDDIIINRSVQEIFDYLSDLSNLSERMPSVKKVEVLSDGKFGLGTQYLVTQTMRGRGVEVINEVSQFEENYSIGFRTISGTQPFEEQYQLKQVEEGTEVRLSASGDMPGLRKLFSKSFQRLLKKQIVKDLERLKELLESRNS